MKTEFRPCRRLLWSVLLAPALSAAALAQDAVRVTFEAANSNLTVGQDTTVTVYGQIDPFIAGQAERIFSYYIDVLNDNGAVAAGYPSFQTPASDNHPSTSGDGTTQGANRRGIYDTFLNTPGAGKGSRIVLARFNVTALAPGTATFRAAAGTTVSNLSEDFVVAKTGGGLFTGGNYVGALVAINVTGAVLPTLADLDFTITVTGGQARLNFTRAPGFDHTVQSSPSLLAPSWTTLPGAPHNAGPVLDPVAGIRARFYRVLLE